MRTLSRNTPLFGIGLCAPRKQYLEDYRIHYPGIRKQQFSDMLDTNLTPENIFLTFTTDLGIPFIVLYILSLAYLLKKLFRSLQKAPPEPFMNPLVILVPILAGLLYFQVYDGLMYPQVNWFFHVLLGMIPMTRTNAGSANGRPMTGGGGGGGGPDRYPLLLFHQNSVIQPD